MPSITRNTTLTKLFEDHYRPLSLVGGAEATNHLYRLYINHLGAFLGRAATVGDFSDETIGRYRAWRKSNDKGVCTINGECKKLLSLWRYTCRLGVLRHWPTIKLEAEPARIPMAFMRNELDQLFQACESMAGTIGEVPAGPWWYALVSICWDSGERIGAVMQLEWSDLDWATAWLMVRAETRKGGKQPMAYPLHAQTLHALRAIKSPKRKRIFPWPYSTDYLWVRYAKVLEAAELPTDRRSKFHRIRRSFASHATAAGMNATELLGQSSLAITKKSYLDPRITIKRHATDVLFRPGTTPEGI